MITMDRIILRIGDFLTEGETHLVFLRIWLVAFVGALLFSFGYKLALFLTQ